MRLPLGFAAVLLVTPAVAAERMPDTVRQADAQFNAKFQCPETLATEEDREIALTQFDQWIAANHLEADTGARVLDLRIALLKHHDCAVELKPLAR